jgi:Lon protease-like protein
MVERLPLFPLGTVLFPGMMLPLHIFEPHYQKMVGHRVGDDPIFGVVLIQSGNEVGDEPDIHDIGTAATLTGMARYDDGRSNLAVRGGRRFQVESTDWNEGYMTGTIEWLDEIAPETVPSESLLALRESVMQEFNAYLDAIERTAEVSITRSELGDAPREVAYAICSMVPLSNTQRQLLLETPTDEELLTELQNTLRHERRLLMATGIGGATNTAAVSRFSTN